MITVPQYKYTGQFTDNTGHIIKMEVYSPYLVVNQEFVFGPDPLHLNFDVEDMFTGAVGRRLSAQIVCDNTTLFDGLFADWPTDVVVKAYKDDVLFFYGFMSNDEYNLSYSNDMRTFTFDALDPILASDNIQYTHDQKARRKLLKFPDVLKAFCDVVGIKKFYYGIEDRDSTFSEDAFLPDDWQEYWRTGNDWLRWSAVLKGLGQTFGCNVFVDADALYICPIVTDEPSNTSFTATMFEKTSTWLETPNVPVNMEVSDVSGYDLKSDLIAGSANLRIIPAKAFTNLSIEGAKTRDFMPDPFDISRWSNDPATFAVEGISTWRTIVDTDTERVTVATFSRDENSRAIPYNYDWTGTFGLLKIYRYNDDAGTYDLSETKLIVINAYLRAYAARVVTERLRSWLEDYDFTAKIYIDTYYHEDLAEKVPTLKGTSYGYNETNTITSSTQRLDDGKYFISDLTAQPGALVFSLNSNGNGSYITAIRQECPQESGMKSNSRIYRNSDFFTEHDATTLCYPLGVTTAKGNLNGRFGSNYNIFNKAVRVYSFESYNTGLAVRPFSHGKFNGSNGQVIAADIDLRDHVSSFSLMISSYNKPSPIVGPFYLKSVDAVILSSNNSTITVPGNGGSYMLQTTLAVTITNGTADLTVRGTAESIRADYGIFLYPVINSKMEIAREETDPRGYYIVGDRITFDEWPLSEIDERVVTVWATCNDKRSSNIVFTQYPNYEGN